MYVLQEHTYIKDCIYKFFVVLSLNLLFIFFYSVYVLSDRRDYAGKIQTYSARLVRYRFFEIDRHRICTQKLLRFHPDRSGDL